MTPERTKKVISNATRAIEEMAIENARLLALLREGLCAVHMDDWRQRVASVIAKAEGEQTPPVRGGEK